MNGNALNFMYSWHANIVYNLIYGDMMFQLSQPSENENLCDAPIPITRVLHYYYFVIFVYLFNVFAAYQ